MLLAPLAAGGFKMIFPTGGGGAGARKSGTGGRVGGGFAEMQRDDRVRAAGEREVERGGLQAERFKFRARIVGDELPDAQAVKFLQRVGDARAVGAAGQRAREPPGVVGRVK